MLLVANLVEVVAAIAFVFTITPCAALPTAVAPAITLDVAIPKAAFPMPFTDPITA